MTQAQPAKLLNVNQSHISRIEMGEQKVRSIDFLWRIVKRLGVEPRRLGISPELMESGRARGRVPGARAVDDVVFDDVFHGIVRRNAEGRLAVVGRNQAGAVDGLPLVGSAVTDLLEWKPMASPGAACLELAWQHRELLLGGAA